MTDAPSSRVSSVVSILGDFNAFCASFLTFGDVIAAGALAIARFYVEHMSSIQVLSPCIMTNEARILYLQIEGHGRSPSPLTPDQVSVTR